MLRDGRLFDLHRERFMYVLTQHAADAHIPGTLNISRDSTSHYFCIFNALFQVTALLP
jgi:hypothetical protein